MSMNLDLDKVQEMTQGAMDAIATGMGTTAEFVWPLVVRQQIVEGVVCYCVLLIALIGLGRFVPKLTKIEGSDESPEAVLLVVGTVCFGIITLVTLMAGFLGSEFLKPFNPEYYALKEVVSMVGKLTP